jgi:spermidine synthase
VNCIAIDWNHVAAKSNTLFQWVLLQWSHELRGFLDDAEKKKSHLGGSSDLGLWVLSPLEMHFKKQVYAGNTKFQRVDIWDIVEVTDTPSYEDVIKYNMTPDDPRLASPEYVTPDRLLFLNGTALSARSDERIYHEAMVHPAMFAHPGPRNVAILGGGEGATLREVLKHKTLESVTMIELDAELVAISREFLPEFSDCSDIVGRAPNCFDDDLAKIEFADGRAWFTDRFSPSPTIPHPGNFDVVLVDALDPEEDSEIAGILYSDRRFLDSMINSLSDNGILAIQVGTAATIDDPRPDFGIYKNREILFEMLEQNEAVQAMLVYEEPNCGFLEPHSFLIVCRSADCRSRWYARSDQVDYEIYDRIIPTVSKKSALTFFDGTTQRTYQWPKRGWETVYCRREPIPWECQFRFLDPKSKLFDFGLEEDEENNFRVETRTDENGEKSSSVFAKETIPKGSYIMPDHLASSLMVTSRNLQNLEENAFVDGNRVPVMEDLMEFFKEYSHPSAMEGSGQHYVEVGATVLIRRVSDAKAANVGPWVPAHPSGHRPKYSPVYERHRNSLDVFMVATRDIAAGEELLIYDDAWLVESA